MTEAFIVGAELALTFGGFMVGLAALGFVAFGLVFAAFLCIDWWVNTPPRRRK